MDALEMIRQLNGQQGMAPFQSLLGLGRSWIGAELNKDYIELIERRTRGTLGLELRA